MSTQPTIPAAVWEHLPGLARVQLVRAGCKPPDEPTEPTTPRRPAGIQWLTWVLMTPDERRAAVEPADTPTPH